MCCSREPPERNVCVSHMKGLVPIESAGGVSHNVPVRIQLRHQRETSFDSESSTTDDSPGKKAKVDENGKDTEQATGTGHRGSSKRMSAEEATVVESFWSSTVSNKWWPFDQVVENARTYCAASFAPGIGPGDIQVDVDGTTLHIEVQDNWDVELLGGDRDHMAKVENTKLHLYRTFELPLDVDSNAMYGNLIDGIFTLVMPKKVREASR
uniref:SHSP domain-containing protein n=1 Tax=Picocystis salinarum TaxID=88271 RepID=A0A7S3XG01_9CHLO